MERGKVGQHTALEYRKRVCHAMDYISRNAGHPEGKFVFDICIPLKCA